MSVDHEAEQRQDLTDEDRAAKVQELMDSNPLPLIQQSIDSFRRDLPDLLKTHQGQWVAYHGEKRMWFGKTQTELYQQGSRCGLSRNDFIVAFVKPGAFDPDEEFAVTHWDI